MRPFVLLPFAVLIADLSAESSPPNLTIRLNSTSTVSGSPKIRIQRPDSGVDLYAASANPEGSFSLPALEQGSYVIRLSQPGYFPVDLFLSDSAPKSGELHIPMRPLIAIEGKVEPAACIAPGKVFAYPDGAIQASAWTEISEGGDYRLHSLSPFRYRLAAICPPRVTVFPPREEDFLEVPRGAVSTRADISLDPLPTFRVSGSLPAKNGDRFGLSLVSLAHPQLAIFRMTTRKDGSFEFPLVTGGRYKVFAAGPVLGTFGKGFLLGSEPLIASKEFELRDGDVQLGSIETGPLISSSLTIRPPESHNCGPVNLSVDLTEDWGFDSPIHRTAKPGETLRLAPLAPGPYVATAVSASGECFGSATLNFSSAEAAHLDLAPAGAVHGTLPVLPNAQMAVRISGPSLSSDVVILVSPDGSFTYRPLQPGRYVLTVVPVSGSDAGPAPPPIELKLNSGANANVTFLATPVRQ